SQPPCLVDFMLVVLEDDKLPLDERLIRLQSFFRGNQPPQIVERFGDVAAYTVLLIGLLRHPVDRHGDVIQAASDEVVDVNRSRPVEVRTNVRANPVAMSVLDDRKYIWIE